MVENCLSDADMDKRNVDEIVLVGGSTRIPKVQELLQNFFNGKELSKRINADEAVAYGASILAAKIRGEMSEKVKNMVFLDVTPLSLGLALFDETMSVLIPRNTTIPTKKEGIFYNARDNISSIEISVFQGERARAEDNNWLGTFTVAVPLAPMGQSKVNVAFQVDANGILTCTGEEVTTGLKKKMTVTNDKGRLSNEEINRMLKDAERYKLEDQEYKKKVAARNALEEYIYDVKSKIKTIGKRSTKKIHKKDMKKMEKALESASRCLDINELSNVNEYEKTLNQLETLCVSVLSQTV